MNCPSRVDCDIRDEGYNQNPSDLAADTTTRNDLNHMANSRLGRDGSIDPTDLTGADARVDRIEVKPADGKTGGQAQASTQVGSRAFDGSKSEALASEASVSPGGSQDGPQGAGSWKGRAVGTMQDGFCVLKKYVKFVGPGFMVAVAYIDPGNYATDVAAGATYRYRLLFMILLSNIFAVFLQSLCAKLGTVTGMNLAEMCRAHFPPWLNYLLYFFAESAIIATDIAEVIGTAIALNLLLKIPLVAGCAISIIDVLIILFFYSPASGNMRALRAFEAFVMLLVLGVVICFCFQLSLISGMTAGEVFRGYLPSKALVESKGLYQACGILGATVMPHSLYLGSGIVQARLKDFDTKNNTLNTPHAELDYDNSEDSDDDPSFRKYRPSLTAIKSCLKYSIIELSVSLVTFALFVNSAILITAGSSLSSRSAEAEDADLFTIHSLLSSTLAPAGGTIFALALLLSGTSAGIVCTIAGQMVSEGQLNWSCRPWMRRLITRSISITPSIIIAGAVGREGLSRALEGSQVALSVILPLVSAPLIWFTCRTCYMTVAVYEDIPDSNVAIQAAQQPGEGGEKDAGSGAVRSDQEQGTNRAIRGVVMRNHWFTATIAVAIWLVVVIMNGALLVLTGMGKT